jgi:very-short-patch-repair endonuclease
MAVSTPNRSNTTSVGPPTLQPGGLRVLRFWNNEVLTNLDGVCLTILNACEGVEN